MIFVTVGGQTPFDRLIRAVDAWVVASGWMDVFAQIGASSEPPHHLKWCRFLEPRDYRERLVGADLVVAHAGTGVLMLARECGRPLLLMPRRASLGETRNEHQQATAAKFASLPGVRVAEDEGELTGLLDRMGEWTEYGAPGDSSTGEAARELIDHLRAFLGTAARRSARSGSASPRIGSGEGSG